LGETPLTEARLIPFQSEKPPTVRELKRQRHKSQSKLPRAGRHRSSVNSILRLQIPELDRASPIPVESPSPGDEGLHVAQDSEPKERLIYSDSLMADQQTSQEVMDETASRGGRFLLVLGILFGLALFAAGAVYWFEMRRFPVVVAISPPDGRDKDPLGNRGALIPLSPDLIHVTSIALGSPRLTIVNGKRLAEEDWLVVKTPQGEASVRVISIQDGFVRFKHGGNTIDARLQAAQATPSPH
jgi:hypothetical protein